MDRLHPEVEQGERQRSGWASSTCALTLICAHRVSARSSREAALVSALSTVIFIFFIFFAARGQQEKEKCAAHQQYAHCFRLLVNTGFSAFN